MTQRIQRTTGALYLGVIALGLSAEFAIRMPLISWADPEATWQAIAANTGLFRLGLLADSAMILLDIGLAVLFFTLLRRVQPELALTAMALRLMQAAVIGASLLASVAALTLVAQGPARPEALMVLLTPHSIGYDVGLIFFGALYGGAPCLREAQGKSDIADHGKIRDEIEHLEDHAQMVRPHAIARSRPQFGEILPQNPDRAGLCLEDPGDYAEQGRLAGAGRATQEQALACLKPEFRNVENIRARRPGKVKVADGNNSVRHVRTRTAGKGCRRSASPTPSLRLRRGKRPLPSRSRNRYRIR